LPSNELLGPNENNAIKPKVILGDDVPRTRENLQDPPMLGWEKPRCSVDIVDVPLNQSLIGAFPSILLIFVSWADVSHGLLDFDESEGRKSDHLLQKNVAVEWCSPNDQQLVDGLEHDLFHILGIIIPTDELIFFRGVQTTNQTRLY